MTRGSILIDGYPVPGVLLDTWPGRLRGWLWRKPGRDVQGVMLVPCRSVHFWGLSLALEVLFVARDGRVLGHARAQPGDPPRGWPGAHAIVELAADHVPPGFAPERVQWMP